MKVSTGVVDDKKNKEETIFKGKIMVTVSNTTKGLNWMRLLHFSKQKVLHWL